MKRTLPIFLLLLIAAGTLRAQDVNALVARVRARLDKVKDYHATGNLKTDVAFLKVPVSRINVWYKSPDRFRIKKDGGISLLPKGGLSFNMRSLLMTENFTAVPAGESQVGGQPTKVVKLLPTDENADIVLTTLYIDEKQELIRRATTTTRENGTYDMQMDYGKYGQWGLPDKVIFSFNTKDYKLPKGVTFEYETGEKPQTPEEQLKNKKGKVEISYDGYSINQGVPESVFH
jgi:outer membrane lipoprotein-sorting protein